MAIATRRAVVALVMSGGFALGGCFIVENFGNYVTDGGAPDAQSEHSLDASTEVSHDALPEVVSHCDADLNTDPKNCGRCDHPCGGGSCEDGSCTAASLISELNNPKGLFVFAGHTGNPLIVYVTEDADGGNVYAWQGGADAGTTTTLATNQDHARDVVAAGTAGVVYWTTIGGVYSCPEPTPEQLPCTPTSVGPKQGTDRITVGGDGALYWTAESSNEIWRLPLSTSGEPAGDAAVYVDGGTITRPLGIAPFNAQQIFFTTLGETSDTGAIERWNVNELGSPVTVRSGLIAPQKVAFASNTMLWTEYNLSGQGGVVGCAFEDYHCQGTSTVGCWDIGGAEGLLANPGEAYFAAQDGIYAMPLPPDGGCYPAAALKVQRLALDRNSPYDLGQYGGFLYWTEYVPGGGLLRVAQP
jgi:hypothetical protein